MMRRDIADIAVALRTKRELGMFSAVPARLVRRELFYR